jgi:Holliday junction resolvase-like predicted endonuclease
MDENVPTFAEIMAMFAESAKRSAEIDAKFDRIAVQIAETEKLMAENAKRSAENDEKFANMREELGNIGHNNGLVAEEIVFHSLEKDRVFAGIQFDFIERGIERSGALPDGKKVKGEYDVVLYNGSSVAIIEVKQRVGIDALKRLTTVQLPRFKQIFPEYKNFKMYLGLGGMSFEKGIAEMAREQGIATLMLSGDVVEINDKDVKAW